MLNERLKGIEGAFMHTFEVGGDADHYYPVAFQVHREESASREEPRMPLVYDIFRVYYEKAPEVLNTSKHHYMGLSLRILCTDGKWDAGANLCKVLYHNYVYNKGVAKVQLFLHQQERRLFVWLRGGGVRYHIRSPIDLSQGTTVLLEHDSVVAPAFPTKEKTYPAVIVSPIAVGSEDPNLVRTGAYTGLGYGLQHDDIKSLDDRVNNLENLPARVGHLETLIARLERLERIVAPFDGISQRFTGRISAESDYRFYENVEIFVTNGIITRINTVKREPPNYGGYTRFTG